MQKEKVRKAKKFAPPVVVKDNTLTCHDIAARWNADPGVRACRPVAYKGRAISATDVARCLVEVRGQGGGALVMVVVVTIVVMMVMVVVVVACMSG